MKVLQVVTQANPQALLQHYLEAYDSLHGHNPQTVAKWRGLVQQSTPVNGGMQVTISIDQDGHYEVDGQLPEDSTRYALDLTPWGEWGQMEVVDATGKNLTLDQQAAHLLYEMAWHGWPEEVEALSDQLRDSMEELERDMEQAKANGEDPLEYMLRTGKLKEWKDIFPDEE